MIKKTN